MLVQRTTYSKPKLIMSPSVALIASILSTTKYRGVEDGGSSGAEQTLRE